MEETHPGHTVEMVAPSGSSCFHRFPFEKGDLVRCDEMGDAKVRLTRAEVLALAAPETQTDDTPGEVEPRSLDVTPPDPTLEEMELHAGPDAGADTQVDSAPGESESPAEPEVRAGTALRDTGFSAVVLVHSRTCPHSSPAVTDATHPSAERAELECSRQNSSESTILEESPGVHTRVCCLWPETDMSSM